MTLTNTGNDSMPQHPHFPPDAVPFLHRDKMLEKTLPGAALALRACALVDLSVAQAKHAAGEHVIACHAGCDECCRQPIPATPLEILLCIRFLRLRQKAEVRDMLAQTIADRNDMPPLQRPCPLLLNGQCAAYAVRPLACRRYMVLHRPCAPGEDATKTRAHEVLQPNRRMLMQALALTLPWYAAWYNDAPHGCDGQNLDDVNRFFRSVTTVMQAVPWKKELSL